MSDLVKRLRRKASLFLSSSGADPNMKLKDVLEWKAAAEIERQDAVIERLGDGLNLFSNTGGKLNLDCADELAARIQYARDNRSKNE